MKQTPIHEIISRMKRLPLHHQIAHLRALIQNERIHSIRRNELVLLLRERMTKQLKKENRVA